MISEVRLFVGSHFYTLILIENEAGRSQFWQNKGSSTARLLGCPPADHQAFARAKDLEIMDLPEAGSSALLFFWLGESLKYMFIKKTDLS